MEGCPIKDDNWKALMKAVNNNEVLARKIWMAYDNNLPPIEKIIEDGFIEGKVNQPRFQPVIDTYINKKKDLHKRLTSLKSQKKFKSTEDRNENKKNIAEIESQIKDTEDTISALRDADNVESMYTYAKSSLEEVKNILSKQKVTSNDLIKVQSIIKLWKRFGTLDDSNPFFTEDEMDAMQDAENITAQNMLRNVKDIQTLAESLDLRWTKIAKDVLLKQVRNTLGEDIEVDFDQAMKDIGKLSSLLLDVSEIDNAIVKSMFVWRKQATHDANKEWIEIEDGLSKVFDKVRKKYTNEQLVDILIQKQSNTDNRPTGDIVHRFSQSWFEFNELRKKKYQHSLSLAEGDAKKSVILKNRAKLKKVALILDPRILFPEDGNIDKVKFNKHKAELISHLGEKGYQFYYDKMQDKINSYKEEKSAQESFLKDYYMDNESAIAQAMDIWEYQNSPYIAAENFNDGTIYKVAGEYMSPSFRYLDMVPRRTVNGKDTGFYDKNFSKVENDSDLLALHNYIMETMYNVRQYLPDDIKRNSHVNTLPFVAKDIMEQFTQSGMSGAFQGIKDGWQKLLASPIGGQTEDSSRRDIEGNKLQEVLFGNNFETNTVIKDYVDRKTIEFKQKHLGDENALIAAQIEWRKEIQQELSKQRSFDIEKIVKMYSLAALSYKHKVKCEDSMKIAYSIISGIAEQQTNNAGSDIKDQNGNLITKQGLPNFKAQLDFFMSGYYGEPTTLQEVPFGDKVYSDLEKKTKKELELLIEQNVDDLKNNVIDKAEFSKRSKILNSQLGKLGKIKTVSNVADTLNMYIRLKGLGWKVFSPIANMNIGYISNITEASGGIKFTMKELHKGYSLVMKKDKKLKNIIKKLDATKDLKNEVYQSSNLTRGWKRKLSPFYLMSESEYVNQAPVVYGLLAHTKVTVNGKEMSLYEAYDENGELPEGVDFSQNKGVVKTLGEAGMKIYIDDTIARIHGNYDPDKQILANKHAILRSLLVFRKWMIATFYNRLSAEKFNDITGISEKGRWRSYSSFFKNYGGFGGSFSIILALLKKASFQKISFDKLGETDEANMKRNLTEITSLIAMMSMALLLKAIAGEIDWDDEDKKRKKSKVKDNSKYLCFFLINQLGRTERDILFYIDPQQFKSVLKDPVPLMGVVTDIYDLMEKSVNLLTGGEDEYSKILTSLRKVTPGATNYDAFKMLTNDILNK